jgi:membrane peptidoglycan carboxypeptidase
VASGPTPPQRRSIRQPATGAQPPAVRPSGTASARPPGAGQPGTRASAAAAARTPSRRRKGLIDYPRYGKTGVRRWLPSWRLVLGVFLTLAAIGIGGLAYAYQSTDIPPPGAFVDAQTTTVYYSDGTTEMGTFGVQKRVIIDQAQIPQHVKDAVVAAEDRSFYENPGINPAGILRALYTNIRGGQRQGGSSITQQYAERYYFDDTVDTYSGKFKEALLAVKLDRAQDKDEILGNYLNTIYFGRDSYGIETAAKSYFGVSASELTISQAALIAGIIPSPNNWDPQVNPEKAEARWNYVLDGMVETGTLSQADRDAQVYPPAIDEVQSDTFAGPQGYLLDMVERELASQASITGDDLRYNGYKIVTTIDKGLEDMAIAAVATLPPDHAPNLRTALVTLDPKDGAILALYGGPDFITQARNAVTQDAAQAGSTFKAFTLVANLEAGNSLESRYSGKNMFPVPGFEEAGGVRNFDDESFGELDVVEATVHSVNAIYAQMNAEVGAGATLDVARRAGICAERGDGADGCEVLLNQEVPSNVLGTASPHPLDLAQAYNTFSSQGTRFEPFIVRTVDYLSGGTAYSGASDPVKVFADDVMADTTYALSQVVEDPEGTGHKAAAIGYPAAGKTGTSNLNKSAWFVGFTRQLTTAVAMYQPGPNGEQESITGFDGVEFVTGGSFPVEIWTEYMTQAMAGREVLDFPPPAHVGEPNKPPVEAIPDVVGMTEEAAVGALGDAGFSAVVQHANDPAAPVGTVFQQNPTGEAPRGSEVVIVVSDGPGTSAVPNVVGMDEGGAEATLEGAGFVVAVTQQEDAAPKGQVVAQNPGGGAEAQAGSTVTIVVSTGPPPKPEPTVVPTPVPTVVPTPVPTLPVVPPPAP